MSLLRSKDLSVVTTVAAHQGMINCIHSGQDWLISGGVDRSVKLWSIESVEGSDVSQPVKSKNSKAKVPETPTYQLALRAEVYHGRKINALSGFNVSSPDEGSQPSDATSRWIVGDTTSEISIYRQLI